MSTLWRGIILFIQTLSFPFSPPMDSGAVHLPQGWKLFKAVWGMLTKHAAAGPQISVPRRPEGHLQPDQVCQVGEFALHMSGVSLYFWGTVILAEV